MGRPARTSAPTASANRRATPSRGAPPGAPPDFAGVPPDVDVSKLDEVEKFTDPDAKEYLHGGDKPNMAMAAPLMVRAAHMGSVEAWNWLGLMYASGIGVDRDQEE
eukprot:gene10613-1929_t